MLKFNPTALLPALPRIPDSAEPRIAGACGALIAEVLSGKLLVHSGRVAVRRVLWRSSRRETCAAALESP